MLLYWRVGRSDLRHLWFALRSPLRPAWLLPVVGLLALYAFEPANFALPPLGLVDDLVVVPLIVHWIVKMLPTQRSGGNSRA